MCKMSNSPEQKIVHALSEFAEALKDGDLSKYRQTTIIRPNGLCYRMRNDEQISKEWACWQLLNGGEGPRGEHVLVVSPSYITAERAAEEAAEYFDDEEIRQECMAESDVDGLWRVIEVETADGPKRFSVQTEVVRKYKAVSLDEGNEE